MSFTLREQKCLGTICLAHRAYCPWNVSAFRVCIVFYGRGIGCDEESTRQGYRERAAFSSL